MSVALDRRRGPNLPSAACTVLMLLLLLSGCASNSVTSLLKASSQTNPIAPSAETVRREFAGHAFAVGTVVFDLRAPTAKQGPDIPDSAYLALFRGQLLKAFTGAKLAEGIAPPHAVNAAIEQLTLKRATFLVPQSSILRVRMEIVPPGGPVLMRGQLQSFLAPPTLMIYSSGFVAPIALPSEGQEYVALAKLFPAVAVVISQTTQGLQQGKTLDQIKIYPKDIEAGTLIGPDLFLEHEPFGMKPMTRKEIDRAVEAARAGSTQ